MVYAFDTLGYAKRLRDAGVAPNHAEAHAEAAREFVMGELVTRYDLETATTLLRRDFEASIAGLRHDVEASIVALRHDVEGSIAALRHDMERLRSELEARELRLMMRLGGMFAISIAILAAIIKL
jgi:hypothetical protein